MASERRGVIPISAKLLGIKLDYRDEPDTVSAADSTSSFEKFDDYVEEEPHAKEWFVKIVPTKASILHYIRTLFPFWNWIFHYNLQWFLGDLVAGKVHLFVY
jgi:sodium-independent sulfate anion transporter 11